MTLAIRVPDRHVTIAVGRWVVCIALVLAVHVAALLTLWSRSSDVPEPAIPSAVLLELAPEPMAPPPAPPTPTVEPTPPQPIEPPPPPQPQPVQEPAPPPEPTEAPEPPKPPDPMPVQPPPDQVPTPDPPAPAIPEPPAEAVLPKPPPPVARPRRPPVSHAPHREVSHPTPQTPPTSAPQVQQAPSVAPVQAAPTPNQAPTTWQSLLRARLAQFKHYPALAQRRGEEGVAQVRFVMDHSGRVLSVALVSGSGHSELDQEALAWIQRAQPLPPPPAEMGQGPIELVIPLRFELH